MEEEPLESQNFILKVSTSFEGNDIQLYEYQTNVLGDRMNFEQVKVYLSDIRLRKFDGTDILLSEIEFFNLTGDPLERSYDVTPGDYVGITYHVGVPTALNGTDDPDFLTNQFGPGNPLNVQNGMYWTWSSGYRFAIYEGRLDTTPSIPNDIPAFFSIHLGKDTLYTTMDVDLPMSVSNTAQSTFHINWDLGKSFYSATDTLDLRNPLESQFHGEDLSLGFRFQTFFKESLTHSVE